MKSRLETVQEPPPSAPSHAKRRDVAAVCVGFALGALVVGAYLALVFLVPYDRLPRQAVWFLVGVAIGGPVILRLSRSK